MAWVMPPASPRHHVGPADGVQQLGLAVVDVTHHGDHRRSGRQVLLATFVLAELDVEALQQLAVLVLGRDDLDVVVELRAEHLQRVVGDRLGRGHHLAQVEQHLDQRARRRRRSSRPGRSARPPGPAGPSARHPGGRARHRSPEPASGRTLDGAASWTCDPDGPDPRPDRRHPGCRHDHRDHHDHWAADRRDRHRDRHDREHRHRGVPGCRRRADHLDGLARRDHRRRRAGRRPDAASSPGWAGACPGTPGRPPGAGVRPAGGRGPPGRRRLGTGARRTRPAHALGGGEGVVARARGAGATGPRTTGARQATGRSGTRPRSGLSLAVARRLTGTGGRRQLLAGCARHTGTRARRTRRFGLGSAGVERHGSRAVPGLGRGRRGRGHRIGRLRRRRSGHDRLRRAGRRRGRRGYGCRRHLGRRCGDSLLDRLLGRRRFARQLLSQSAHHWRLHGGGGRSDELPHVPQRREDGLAFDSELFRKLVDTDLCHCSPCWRSAPKVRTS